MLSTAHPYFRLLFQFFTAIRLSLNSSYSAALYAVAAVSASSPAIRAAAAAVHHWWNVIRLASLQPWLMRSANSFMRRAALDPYPVLHRRQQRVAMETDDATLATPTAEPEVPSEHT